MRGGHGGAAPSVAVGVGVNVCGGDVDSGCPDVVAASEVAELSLCILDVRCTDCDGLRNISRREIASPIVHVACCHHDCNACLGGSSNCRLHAPRLTVVLQARTNDCWLLRLARNPIEGLVHPGLETSAVVADALDTMDGGLLRHTIRLSSGSACTVCAVPISIHCAAEIICSTLVVCALGGVEGWDDTTLEVVVCGHHSRVNHIDVSPAASGRALQRHPNTLQAPGGSGSTSLGAYILRQGILVNLRLHPCHMLQVAVQKCRQCHF